MSHGHIRASAFAAARDFGFVVDSVDVAPSIRLSPSFAAAGLIEVWTDGSCRPNPGPGGWSAVLRAPDGTEQEISGTEVDTTNSRMELRAAIAALEALPVSSLSVTIHTDSEYVQRGMTAWVADWVRKGWPTGKGKPVENRDLWERLTAAAAPHRVDWRWTRGHAGDPMNERVDRLAAAARERLETTAHAGPSAGKRGY